ncbi:MAG: serine hydrolase [Patescibacteria group bacterium]|nr:serine hydrolase [Patescibacteria group bacterium]
MKKILAAIAVLGCALPTIATAAEVPLSKRLTSRFLLQSDAHDAAWYVHPATNERYSLRDSDICFSTAASLALGISDADLAKLATPAARKRNAKLASRLRGRFLLAVQQHGALLYFSPVDSARSPIPDGDTCLTLAKRLGQKVKTKELASIPMNTEQLIFDPAFSQVASAKIVNGKPVAGRYPNQILPIASLTKLMTALVISDLKPDWEREITLTAEDLAYPQTQVDPGDITSEVAFAVGDTVTVRELWVAMLVSSSNQAAITLADHSGLPIPAFVSAMNSKSRALGLNRTVFIEPTGLDPDNISTAAEMAKIAAAAFANPTIADTTVLKEFTIAARQTDGAIRAVPVTNRNYSLLQFSVDGAKTGFLYEAQRTVAVRKGNTIAVVLHARSMSERNQLLTTFLGEPKKP